MVALSAKRLVWPALSLMSSTTSPILWAASARPWTVLLARSASSTAPWEILVDSATWRPISSMELESSSVAEATVWTLVDASSEAAATAVA
jgi:hypothetical protein